MLQGVLTSLLQQHKFLCNTLLSSSRPRLHHQTHPQLSIISAWPSGIILSGAVSYCSPLFPVAYWTPSDLGRGVPHLPGSLSFCLFILSQRFLRQKYCSGLPFPSPVDHVLQEPMIVWIAVLRFLGTMGQQWRKHTDGSCLRWKVPGSHGAAERCEEFRMEGGEVRGEQTKRSYSGLCVCLTLLSERKRRFLVKVWTVQLPPRAHQHHCIYPVPTTPSPASAGMLSLPPWHPRQLSQLICLPGTALRCPVSELYVGQWITPRAFYLQ